MNPGFQYARTSDGVSIAYWSYGEGPFLVTLPSMPLDTFPLESLIPTFRTWGERAGRHHRVLTYDARGLGLSDRSLTFDLSLQAYVRDLEAVVDAEGVESFALLAPFRAAAVAVAYAATYPDRVSRLVLWCGTARGSDYEPHSRFRVSRDLLRNDWDAYIETIAFYIVGWTDADLGRKFAAYLRANFDQASVSRLVDAYDAWDATPYLADVRVPTLVMHRSEVPWPDINVARSLAASIKGSRMVVIEGRGAMPWLGDNEPAIRAIESFLGVEAAATPPEPAQPRPLESATMALLTPREREILRLLAAGSSNKEIAAELAISVHTVERHTANIYMKIDARGRADAIAYALRHGLASDT